MVGKIGDALDALVLDEVGDALDELDLVDHVRDLRHLDAAAAVFLEDLAFGAQADGAAPGRIGGAGAGAADDGAAGREVGAFDELHQVVERRVGMVDLIDDRVDDLA